MSILTFHRKGKNMLVPFHVQRKVTKLIRDSKRILSAHCDMSVKKFLDHVGNEQHWQQNGVSPNKSVTYEFQHFEEYAMSY